MRAALLAIVVSPLLSLLACAGNPAAPAGLPLGKPFELRHGQSAVVQGGLKVTFERVVSDSRCPMDAICVWAGEAVLGLTLSRGGGTPELREVRADSAAPEIEFSSYRIRAVSLAPYPRSDRKPAPEEFVATFTVTQ